MVRLACLATLAALSPAFGQPGPPWDSFRDTGAVSAASSGATSEFNRRDVTLSGSRLILPVIASAETSNYGKLYTVLEIANITDSDADYSLRFLGADGTALSMPIRGSCPTCVVLASSLQATVGAHGGGRIVVLSQNPLKVGWAEFTADPAASLSVSAMLYAQDTDGNVGRAGVPPTSTYKRAWLYTDNTSDFTTRVVLVNPSATGQRTYQLQYRDYSDTSSTCQASVQIAALGQVLIETADSLACSSGDRGLVEISGDHGFTGISIVPHGGDGTIFTRQLVAMSALGEEHPRLDQWTITTGSVTYGSTTSAGCITVGNTSIDGVVHTVHTSKWQKRADEDSAWTDIPNTSRNGLVCAYSNSANEDGQYRGLADITIGDERGTYASKNVLTVAGAPGTTDSQPSFATTVGNQPYQVGTAISPLTLPAASGGDGSLAYSLSPGVPGLSFDAATRALEGTPTAAATYNMTYTVRDVDGDIATLNFVVTVATAQMTSIDLVVASVMASDDTPAPGRSFDLTATTSNRGTAASAATTLRFYRSTDTTISSSDSEIGTDAVSALAAGGTSSSVLTLTAPSTSGTYFYGACVDPVSGESDSANNCSASTAVTVRSVSTAVTIPDAGLRAAIEAALGKASSAPITAAEMATLTALELQDLDVSDLTGLELATNMTELLLWNSSGITDLSPLAGLTNLTWLRLGGKHGGDPITDLSPLAGLTNLNLLFLSQLGITDLSPLAGLTNLTRLRLDDNWIADVSPLAGLTNLTLLMLNINRITDVSPLTGLTNLSSLNLKHNEVTDVSPLASLTRLKNLELVGNILSDSSLNDHIPVLEGRGVTIRFHSLRKGDFDIELVFLGDFDELQKNQLRWVTRRWMSVITGDLPDYEFAQGWSGTCGDQSLEIPSGEQIDDLRIYVNSFDGPGDPEVAGFNLPNIVGYGGPRLLRDTHLPIVGCMSFNSEIYDWRIVGLHEMGHVLGFGPIWHHFGFLQDYSRDNRNRDKHFNGPLAIAAFDDAGGRDYTGAKVPVVDGGHWRRPVLHGELMSSGGGSALSAITVQSLADLGYGVDVSQADAYTLPGASTTETSGNDAATAARAMPAATIREDDRLRGSLASPVHAELKLWCGLGGEREPIHAVDQQGRIILTIGN